MSELLKVYSSYDELEINYFFTIHFNAIPSEVFLELSLEETKKNIESVLKVLSLEKENFNIVFKHWKTEDSSNADNSKDFPFVYLYKSNKEKCIVFISLENDTLKVKMLYDCINIELEKWVLNTNHKLRSNFGLKRTPTFKVLIKHHMFDTENVKSQETIIDIDKNYNNDFSPVNDRISKSIEANESGIILLHGEPGTGKTTYIKSLITNYIDTNFVFIQNEFISNLLDPDFITFLLKQRNTILVIEDAEKVIASRENENQSSVVSTILQLTDGLFSDYLNIKVICTFNTSLSKIDTALLRKGRMIAMYKFKPLSIVKTNELLKAINIKKADKELTIADIYNYKQNSFIEEKKKIGF